MIINKIYVCLGMLLMIAGSVMLGFLLCVSWLASRTAKTPKKCSCHLDDTKTVAVEIVGIGVPEYETPGAAGADLRSAHEYCIPPGCTMLVRTGLRIAVPPGYEAQVRPRSGLALRNGITVLNSPGTIDSDYRGEIGVILYNAGTEAFCIIPCDRIAQLVFAPVVQARFVKVETLSDTERGEGGFGSTGK